MTAKNDGPTEDDGPITTWVSLSAQIPATAPDTSPSIYSVRELTHDEVRQFRADSELLGSLVAITPYARASTAYEELASLVADLASHGIGRPTPRASQQLSQQLRAVATAVGEMPSKLAEALATRFDPDTEAVLRLADATARLKDEAAYKLTIAMERCPVDHLLLVRQKDRAEVVVTPTALAEWTAPEKLFPAGQAVGLVATVETALALSGPVLLRWMLEHRDLIDDASRRVAKLNGEVFQGSPAVVEIRMRAREGDEPDILGMTPLPLPLAEMYALQASLEQARRVLEHPDSEPALRASKGMSAEHIAAVTGIIDAADLDDAKPSESPPGVDEPVADPEARPLDVPSLVAHLYLGAEGLERAWSRALEDSDIQTVLAQWTSTVQALLAEIEHADGGLPAEERRFELPPSSQEIAGLVAEPDSQASDRQSRLAQVMLMADLLRLIPALRAPTRRMVDRGSGSVVNWFSSGAFAALRDHLELLMELTAITERPSPAVRSLRLAQRAEVRADPEATLIHVARALDAVDATDLAHLDVDDHAVLARVRELAPRIAAGEPLDLATISLTGSTALLIVHEALKTPEPAGPTT
jgi:hypothetical protein